MNVLLLTSHAIAEHDDLDMFTRMGVPCYSIGGAYDEVPFEGKRPALPDAPRFPELEEATARQRCEVTERLGDPGPHIDWGKAILAAEVIDWADVIIVHHFPERWIGDQWDRIRHKRVVWRTCGQSDPRLELAMSRYRAQGLQIVRYSPREREVFGRLGVFAGEDALIRFGKDPDEWTGWVGDLAYVGNITQHMAQRGDSCGYPYWVKATEGLPTMPAGPGSEALPNGMGSLEYDAMREYLRRIRVYLYTGTRPASYTLGLIEAAMTGVPVVTIGPGAFGCDGLLERLGSDSGPWLDDPAVARDRLLHYLEEPREAASRLTRDSAVRMFGLAGVMAAWTEFLA